MDLNAPWHLGHCADCGHYHYADESCPDGPCEVVHCCGDEAAED